MRTSPDLSWHFEEAWHRHEGSDRHQSSRASSVWPGGPPRDAWRTCGRGVWRPHSSQSETKNNNVDLSQPRSAAETAAQMKLWGPLSVYHASPLTQPSPGENRLNCLHQGEDLLVVPFEVNLKVALWGQKWKWIFEFQGCEFHMDDLGLGDFTDLC